MRAEALPSRRRRLRSTNGPDTDSSCAGSFQHTQRRSPSSGGAMPRHFPRHMTRRVLALAVVVALSSTTTPSGDRSFHGPAVTAADAATVESAFVDIDVPTEEEDVMIPASSNDDVISSHKAHDDATIEETLEAASGTSRTSEISNTNTNTNASSDPPSEHEGPNENVPRSRPNDEVGAPIPFLSQPKAEEAEVTEESSSDKSTSKAMPKTALPKTTKVMGGGGFTAAAAAAAKVGVRPAVGINFTSATITGGASENSSRQQDDLAMPDGFTLAARIVSIEGLSYFIDDAMAATDADKSAEDSERIDTRRASADRTVPYLDCGAVGSFTDSISMKECSFRHLPAGAEPIGWTTVDSPQLVVALRPLEVKVSGGGGDDGMAQTRRIFQPGDVLLFEDATGKGHKLAPLKPKMGSKAKSATTTLHPDMSVLIISLPRHSHHLYQSPSQRKGGDKIGSISLPSLFGGRSRAREGSGGDDADRTQPPRPCLVEMDGTYSSLGPAATLSDISPARIVRGVVGAALSAFVTYGFSRKTQLWISGCVGGGALVAGGACAFAAVGEGTLDSISDWWEEFIVERRFASATEEEDSSMDDDISLEDLDDQAIIFGAATKVFTD